MFKLKSPIGMDFSCTVLWKLFSPDEAKKITSSPVYCTELRQTHPTPDMVSSIAIVAGDSAPPKTIMLCSPKMIKNPLWAAKALTWSKPSGQALEISREPEEP